MVIYSGLYGMEEGIGMWWAKGYSGIYIKGYMMNG